MSAFEVDGRRHEAAGGSMRELMAEASTLVSRGNVIARVFVDGIEEMAYLNESFLSKSTEGVGLVRIETQPLRDVLLQGMDLGRSFLLQVVRQAEHIALGFRKADVTEASEQLLVVADGLKGMVQMLDSLREHFPELFKTFTSGGGTLDEHVGSLTEILKSITAAQSESDWVVVADAVEYELADKAQEWQILLGELRQRVATENQ